MAEVPPDSGETQDLLRRAHAGGVTRRLVAWCGLEWEPACLAFYEGKGPVRTASVAQVRQPIYTRSVARWKNYEQSLGALFAKLGPEPGNPLAQVGSPNRG